MRWKSYVLGAFLLVLVVTVLLGVAGWIPRLLMLETNTYPKIGLLTDYSRTGRSYFGVDTVLMDLAAGGTHAFSPQPPTSTSLVGAKPAEWTQQEFLQVANGFGHYLWQDDLQKWAVYDALFATTCRSTPKGFSSADLVVFMPNEHARPEQYVSRELIISAELGEVDWGDGANFPKPFFAWKGVSLSDLTIAAEAALGAAETHGGAVFREGVNNQCKISVSINNSAFRGWRVEYIPDSFKTPMLTKYIDSSNGAPLH